MPPVDRAIMIETPKASNTAMFDGILIEAREGRVKKESKPEPSPIKVKLDPATKKMAVPGLTEKPVVKTDVQVDRSDYRAGRSKESSSSCRPSPVAKSKLAVPPSEAFDLPIILVPALHSRGELVLENFVQMFAHGK